MNSKQCITCHKLVISIGATPCYIKSSKWQSRSVTASLPYSSQLTRIFIFKIEEDRRKSSSINISKFLYTYSVSSYYVNGDSTLR